MVRRIKRYLTHFISKEGKCGDPKRSVGAANNTNLIFATFRNAGEQTSQKADFRLQQCYSVQHVLGGLK